MSRRIFINYAREDSAQVEAIYTYLSENGFDPWMDTAKLIGGQPWNPAIHRTIRNSDLFLICLSAHSAGKTGVIQDERDEVLKRQQYLPNTEIFLIPVRLEPVELPENLGRFQWVDWFAPDGRDRLLAAVQKAVDRRERLSRSFPPLAINVMFIRQGGTNEIYQLQSEKNFDIRTGKAKQRAIDDVEASLPHDRSQINTMICLLGDHLIGHYDYSHLKALLEIGADHRWGNDRYIVLNKRIGGIADHDYDSLTLWFESVRQGGAADILEVRYESRAPDASLLSSAVNRSIIRQRQIHALPCKGEWKCLLSNASRDKLRFLNEFLAPAAYRGNHVILVESGHPASQTRWVYTAMANKPGLNYLVATIDVAPSQQLIKACTDQGLGLIECRGPFELRYFLLKLNSPAIRV